MKPDHALNILVNQLEKAAIPHMITGSFASTYHGISRTTLDIDVVIDPDSGNFPLFLNGLARNGFYVSEANAKAGAGLGRTSPKPERAGRRLPWDPPLQRDRGGEFGGDRTPRRERRVKADGAGVPVGKL